MIILITTAIILLILLLTPVHLKTETLQKKDKDLLLVKVKALFGVIKFKLELPFPELVFDGFRPGLRYSAELEAGEKGKLIKKKSKIMSLLEFDKLYESYKLNKGRFNKLFQYVLKKSRFRNLIIRLEIGAQDAFYTALAYGMVWTALGGVIAFMTNNANIALQDISVYPSFDKKAFNYKISCIITMLAGHIIIVGIKLVAALLNSRKKEIHLKY
ncbi:MAG: DUF2953 domain-containing protein [Bacillota bacterium]